MVCTTRRRTSYYELLENAIGTYVMSSVSSGVVEMLQKAHLQCQKVKKIMSVPRYYQ